MDLRVRRVHVCARRGHGAAAASGDKVLKRGIVRNARKDEGRPCPTRRRVNLLMEELRSAAAGKSKCTCRKSRMLKFTSS